MELTQVIALLSLAGGGAYAALAGLASIRAPRREPPEEEGRVLLSIEPDGVLVEGEATDDRMHKVAALGASIAGRIFRENLDYSPESVARLDRLIVAGWGQAATEETALEVPPEVLLSFGAYLGEVLVRRTRGRWVSGFSESDPGNVLFLSGSDDVVSVSPFLLVAEKFNNMYGFDLAVAFTALEQKLKELKMV